MSFDINDWKRFEYEEIPIYFNNKEPDRFVPDSSDDRLLKDIAGYNAARCCQRDS